MFKKFFLTLLLCVALLVPSLASATLTDCLPTARWDYTGNASTTAFPYTCRITNKAHIVVLVDGVIKTLDTDYTVDGVDNAAGGNVNFTTAPASAAKIAILRSQPLEQQSNYIANQAFPAESVEKDLDKLAMLDQQQQEEIGRALKFKKQSLKKNIDVVDPVAGQFTRWSTDGLTLESVAGTATTSDNFTASGTGAVVRTETSKLGDILHARDFGVTCDGATDDTTAFSNAVNRALALSRDGLLVIQEGTCLIDGKLIDSVTGLSIIGQGRGSTILKKRVVASPAQPVLDITNSSDIRIADLTIDGNKTASEEGGAFNNNTNSGIRCVNCSDVTLSHIRIQKTPGWAVSFRPTNNNQKNVYLYDVQTDDTSRVDFGGNGTANVQIDKLVSRNFHDTSAEGWVFDQGGKNGFTLENSELHGTAVFPAIGMTLRGGPNAKIIHNFIKLIREGNVLGIEIGEGQVDTIIAENRIEITPVNAAKNQGINFAVAGPGVIYDSFIITGNTILNRGGDSLAAHIHTDESDLKNITVSNNILKSSNAAYTGSYIKLSAGASSGTLIIGNTLDGSNLTGTPDFMDLAGSNAQIVSNIVLGGSGAEFGIIIRTPADNWFVCGNVFKNVGTETNFTTATNIVLCNTTAPVTDTYTVKAADETVNNSATLQNDDHLVFACATNSSYTVAATLLLTGASATADWKFGWTVPASATAFWGGEGGGSTATDIRGHWGPHATSTTAPPVLLSESGTLSAGSVAGTQGLNLTAIVRCAGTAGNVQLQWAQDTATVEDSKVLKDSFLKYRKLQ